MNARGPPSEGDSDNDGMMGVEEPAKERRDVCGIQAASQLLLYGARWVLLRGNGCTNYRELLHKRIV